MDAMREEAEGTSLWRRSGALRWTVYLLLIFVVPQTILWVTLDTINRRKVERKLQALRDAGQPVTMSELAPAPVPDDQNAAILYQQVIRVDFGDRMSTDNSLLEATGHSQLVEFDFGGNGLRVDQARAVLNDPAVISIFETLEEASLRPECVFPLHWGDGQRMASPHRSQLREAARWLRAKARMATTDENPDEALRWLGVLFRMSDHVAQEPTGMAQLTVWTMSEIGLRELARTLAETTPSAEATQKLQDCLQRLDVKKRFAQSLPGERAMGIESYMTYRHPRPVSYWTHQSEAWLIYCYRFEAFRPLYNADLSKYLTRMEEVEVLAARVPAPPDLYPKRELRVWFGVNVEFVQLVDRFDFLGRMLEKRDRGIMRTDIARVALGLTLYKIEQGEYPATLDELQATLEWELPQDFFAGAALSYQRRGDGFLLYSFGVDRDDDGGVQGKGYDDGDFVWGD